MRGGLIDGWEDFVKKFQIRFAPLHDLNYVCFEKTSEKSRDTFAHMVENANTLLAPTVEDTNELKESSEESFIKEDNDSGSDIIGDDGGALEEDYVGMTIVGYEVLASIEKVADADKKQVDNLISFDDTIKLFDLVDVVKTEHLVSPRATTYAMRPVSFFLHFSTRAKLVEDSKSGLLLWFNILSLVLKHEWEPPP
ncbi:unnamed protein product [Cuscuta campestris]|uniref:Uncharacterized protein n=1 Tax=Cuscuta campestris TaxID=132261 RepID=A0A484KUM5_9ASTE|nr:unnamed protein product [Cuscuta campestris]